MNPSMLVIDQSLELRSTFVHYGQAVPRCFKWAIDLSIESVLKNGFRSPADALNVGVAQGRGIVQVDDSVKKNEKRFFSASPHHPQPFCIQKVPH